MNLFPLLGVNLIFDSNDNDANSKQTDARSCTAKPLLDGTQVRSSKRVPIIVACKCSRDEIMNVKLQYLSIESSQLEAF